MVVGGFAISPEAARRAASLCRAQIAEVDAAVGVARAIERVDYGGCALGRAMTGKLAGKVDARDGFLHRMGEVRLQLERMARTFEATGLAYSATDDDGRARLGGSGAR